MILGSGKTNIINSTNRRIKCILFFTFSLWPHVVDDCVDDPSTFSIIKSMRLKKGGTPHGRGNDRNAFLFFPFSRFPYLFMFGFGLRVSTLSHPELSPSLLPFPSSPTGHFAQTKTINAACPLTTSDPVKLVLIATRRWSGEASSRLLFCYGLMRIIILG